LTRDLAKLIALRLDGNPNTDAVVDSLVGLKRLRATRITSEGVARPEKALPDRDIRYAE